MSLRHVSNVSTWGPQLATYQKMPYMPATWTQFKKTKTKKKNPLFGIWIIISLIVTRTKHMRSVWSEMYNWKCLWVVTADLLIAYLLLLHCVVRKRLLLITWRWWWWRHLLQRAKETKMKVLSLWQRELLRI